MNQDRTEFQTRAGTGRADRQRGAILLMVLFVIFLVAVLFIGMGLLHRSDLEIITIQVEDLQALYCADVGAQRALYDIRKNAAQPNWPGGGRSVGLDPYGGAQDCVTNIPGSGGGSPANPDAQSYASRGTYTVQVTEFKADDNIPGAVYNYLMITSTARVNPPSQHKRSVTIIVRRAQRWSLIPGAFFNYYTQIRQYQEY